MINKVYKNYFYGTCLNKAIENGNTDVVKLLLNDSKIDVNKQSTKIPAGKLFI